jgi:hypothetical protein
MTDEGDEAIIPGAVKVTGGGTHVPGVPQPELYQLNLKSDELGRYHAIFQKLKAEGLGDGMPLHVMTVLTMEMNRLLPLSRSDANKAKQLKETVDQLNKLTTEAQKRRDARAAGESLPKLHARYMRDARKYVEDHVGELTLSCQNCGEVLTTDGLPHWAIAFVPDEAGEIIYFKWSPEVMHHYNEGTIPLHVAAHILRTSPKALFHTAEKWKTPLKQCNIEEEEGRLKALLDADVAAWEKERAADLEAEEENTP